MNIFYKGEDITIIFSSENDISDYTKVVKVFTPLSSIKTASIAEIDSNTFSATITSTQTADLKTGNFNIVLELTQSGSKAISKTVKAKLNDAYLDGGEREDSNGYTYQLNFTEGNHIDINFGANFIISQVFSWFTFIWKLFTGFTIAELRLLTNSQLALVSSFSCVEQGRIKDWYYDSTDTTSADNNGTVLVTTSGKRLKATNYTYLTPENFGADGIDDTNAIQNATNYLSSNGGGKLYFLDRIYYATHLYFKRGVSWEGLEKYSSSAIINNLGTTIKCISNTFQESFVELYSDNQFPSQNGEIDGLPKSLPELTSNNIIYDANFICHHSCTIKQAWGFELSKNKFIGGYSYSLNITDCNEFKLTDNIICGYLSISNADYIETDNDISGYKKFPSIMSDRTGLGVRNSNKVYLGGDSFPHYQMDISSINNGIFTYNPINQLTINPNWRIFESGGSFSFNQDTQTTTINSNNGEQVVIVTGIDEAKLIKGYTYRLSGSIVLSGSSANRTVVFSNGNVTQQYTSINTSTSTTNFNVTFTFNPLLNNATSPLKITVNSTSISGTDIITITNLKINSTTNNELQGLPVVFNFPDTADNTLQNDYTHSEVFYPKFLSETTFVLYPTLSSYFNNSGYLTGTYTTLTGLGYNVSVPNCLWHLSGKSQGQSSVNNSNKVEDIRGDGIVLRGVYNNVFEGNILTKGIKSKTSKLFSIVKGASYNEISGIISNRTNATSTDLTYIGVYIDKFSGNNKISAKTDNALYLDILDEYQGSKFNRNEYIGYSGNRFINKPIDYLYSKKRLKLLSGKIGFVTNNNTTTPIITDTSEFSLIFKNVRIESPTNITYLFQQKDISQPNQDGRFIIKISSDGKLNITINSTDIILTDANVITASKDYDICIVKSALNIWYIYVDGILISSANGISTNIATATNTKSYIGSADNNQGSNLYISDFMYFNEELTEVEIKNIFSSNSINYKPISVQLDGESSGLSVFSTTQNSTITLDSGSGVDGNTAFKFVNSYNSNVKLNISSSTTKNEIIRLSGYIKSSNATKLGINRKTNYRFLDITSSYRKISAYINIDKSNSSTESINLLFGNFIDGQFNPSFSPDASTVYWDRLKLTTNQYPILVHLDFSDEVIESNYSNKLNITDKYFSYDGIGGFYFYKDSTNTKFVLRRNTNPLNLIGTDALEFDSSGNLSMLNALKIYSNIFSKSGNTLQLGTEGANSLQFVINNAVNAQIFGSSGNMFIGTSPSDSGDKLQVSGTSLFTSKIKFSTGTNKPVGSGTLVAGTVTISNTLVTSSSIIILARTTSGGTTGTLSYTKNAGVGFTVSSTSNTDTSTFDYLIIN